jgi:hypothetical protein
MGGVKRYASLVLAALVLAAPAAAAKKPTTTTAKKAGGKGSVACRNRIINQWEGTGKISTNFAPACYKLALNYVKGHSDVQEYSSLGDDIRLALQAALERQRGEKVPARVGKHYGKPANVGFTTSTEAGPTKKPPKGPGGGSPSAATDTSSSSGLPLPVIILGALAIALVAAGAIGAGLRARRR